MWVLSADWVYASIGAGRVLPEAEYDLSPFATGAGKTGGRPDTPATAAEVPKSDFFTFDPATAFPISKAPITLPAPLILTAAATATPPPSPPPHPKPSSPISLPPLTALSITSGPSSPDPLDSPVDHAAISAAFAAARTAAWHAELARLAALRRQEAAALEKHKIEQAFLNQLEEMKVRAEAEAEAAGAGEVADLFAVRVRLCERYEAAGVQGVQGGTV